MITSADVARSYAKDAIDAANDTHYVEATEPVMQQVIPALGGTSFMFAFKVYVADAYVDDRNENEEHDNYIRYINECGG